MPATRADVKVGFACNNRCVFCAQGHKREGCPFIDLPALVHRLELGRTTSDELVLTGGEPTLHPQILELVHAARELGYARIQIQTNGRRLCYLAFVDALIEAGATEFSPALHGHTKLLHEALTRAAGSFEQTVRGIQNVVLRGASVVTNTVVVRANLPHLPALTGLLARLGVAQAQLAFVHPVGTAQELCEQVVPRFSDLVAPLRLSLLAANRHGMRLCTEAVPLCFLRDMEELAVEKDIPSTTVIDLDGSPFDFSGWRPTEGKSHGPPCLACAARLRCEGPWREYPELNGWDEFCPVSGSSEGEGEG